MARSCMSNESPRERRTPEMQKAPDCAGACAFEWWPGSESNQRHADFQSAALPTELPGQRAVRPRGPNSSGTVAGGARIKTAACEGVKAKGRSGCASALVLAQQRDDGSARFQALSHGFVSVRPHATSAKAHGMVSATFPAAER
jgi:hypothetical protein